MNPEKQSFLQTLDSKSRLISISIEKIFSPYNLKIVLSDISLDQQKIQVHGGADFDITRSLAKTWKSDLWTPGDIFFCENNINDYNIKLGLYNIALALNLETEKNDSSTKKKRPTSVAIDAGPFWLFIHPKGKGQFLRKDKPAKQIKLLESYYTPQDQEMEWSKKELELASQILWQAILFTLNVIGADYEKDPTCLAAFQEILAQQEKKDLQNILQDNQPSNKKLSL